MRACFRLTIQMKMAVSEASNLSSLVNEQSDVGGVHCQRYVFEINKSCTVYTWRFHYELWTSVSSFPVHKYTKTSGINVYIGKLKISITTYIIHQMVLFFGRVVCLIPAVQAPLVFTVIEICTDVSNVIYFDFILVQVKNKKLHYTVLRLRRFNRAL